MKRIVLVLVGVWGLMAGTGQAQQPTPAATSAALLNNLFNSYWDDRARLFPLLATAQGDNRYNDRLPNDQTRAFRQQQARLYRRYLNDLLNIDRARLGPEDKLSYDIFQYEMRNRLEGLRLDSWMMPFAQVYSLPTTLTQLGAGTGAQPFRTVKDYDNWLSRVSRFPVWADSAIANFREGAKAAVVVPRVLVLKMVPQLQAQVMSDPIHSVFYSAIYGP